ncbi:hypothetical protein [Endozoicomonas euniceicola]|uniref:Uncharacterized protein n=1 Tax=Endozoicomonas euniceicola TaxID=1234143 RepID=A0ABY6GX86_9GAMM|nr:hypothetical protein [Endozoicomonas euniceicola]UYM16676.1 hypothetical protein NX720_01715 [Endozoicomonas euniceicola]
MFDVQRDHGHLIRLTMRLLNKGGTPYFPNNFHRSYWKRLFVPYIGNSDYTADCFFYAFEAFSFLLSFAVLCCPLLSLVIKGSGKDSL